MHSNETCVLIMRGEIRMADLQYGDQGCPNRWQDGVCYWGGCKTMEWVQYIGITGTWDGRLRGQRFEMVER